MFVTKHRAIRLLCHGTGVVGSAGAVHWDMWAVALAARDSEVVG